MHVGAKIGLMIGGGIAAGVATERLLFADRQSSISTNVMVGGVAAGATIANANAVAKNTFLHPAIGVIGLTAAAFGTGMIASDLLFQSREGAKQVRTPHVPTGPVPSPSPGPAPSPTAELRDRVDPARDPLRPTST